MPALFWFFRTFSNFKHSSDWFYLQFKCPAFFSSHVPAYWVTCQTL